MTVRDISDSGAAVRFADKPDNAVYVAEIATRALFECYLLSGADTSDYGHETRTAEGREAAYQEWLRRGSTSEVVEAVRQLREDYDEPPTCDQCGNRSIMSVREVCRDCFKRDKKLDEAQCELYQAVMAHEFSSVDSRTWPRVSDAAHRLMEFYQ